MLQDWFKSHPGAAFGIVHTPNEGADSQANTNNFGTLVRLLQDKGIVSYALIGTVH